MTREYPFKQRDYKRHEGGEQGGTGRQTVEAVDQVEGVGDGQDPQNRERQAHEPWQLMLAEEHGDIENAKTAHEQHGGGQRLHGELDVGADGVKIVIESQQENEGCRHQDGQQGLQRKRRVQARNVSGQERQPRNMLSEKEMKMATPPRRGRGWSADAFPEKESQPSRAGRRNPARSE